MPALAKPKWERFAAGVAQGLTLSDAFRQAGFTAKTPGAIGANASRLLKRAVVRARVDELTAEFVEKSKLSKQWVLDGLKENFERAMQRVQVIGEDGKPSGRYTYQGQVANKALELIGQELGMFVEHVVEDTTVKIISDRPMTPEQWAAEYGVPGEAPLKIGGGTTGSAKDLN